MENCYHSHYYDMSKRDIIEKYSISIVKEYQMNTQMKMIRYFLTKYILYFLLFFSYVGSNLNVSVFRFKDYVD